MKMTVRFRANMRCTFNNHAGIRVVALTGCSHIRRGSRLDLVHVKFFDVRPNAGSSLVDNCYSLAGIRGVSEVSGFQANGKHKSIGGSTKLAFVEHQHLATESRFGEGNLRLGDVVVLDGLRLRFPRRLSDWRW